MSFVNDITNIIIGRNYVDMQSNKLVEVINEAILLMVQNMINLSQEHNLPVTDVLMEMMFPNHLVDSMVADELLNLYKNTPGNNLAEKTENTLELNPDVMKHFIRVFNIKLIEVESLFENFNISTNSVEDEIALFTTLVISNYITETLECMNRNGKCTAIDFINDVYDEEELYLKNFCLPGYAKLSLLGIALD
jgi:hypothetical protein